MKIYAFGFMLMAFLVCIAPPCLSASGSSQNVSHIKVPIKVENLPRGTLVTSPLVQGIEIQVRGPAEIRSRLSDLDLQYRLDLSHLEPGSHTVPIQVKQLDLPPGLAVDDFQPQAISIQLELEARKQVPITVFYKGTPAVGYFVVQTVAVPNMVMLSGPKQELDKIESVSTHPIDVAGMADTFKKEITLALPENIKSIALTDPILVSVEISEEIQTRNYKGILVEILGSRDQSEINPPYVNMEIKGPVTLLEGLTKHPDFRVSVDTAGLVPGVYVRRATIELPVGTTLIQVTPEIFTVTISDQQ
jgi:YbbR domain-containing protein